LLAAGIAFGPAAPTLASSHMDAPLITLDSAANTTDVYAFLSREKGVDYLTTALAVYPFEEPGIGPNNYRFDDRVRYEMHVSLGDDVPKGKKTITYRYEFNTEFQNLDTIRQAFLGPLDGDPSIEDGGFFTNQNMRQSYTVTKIDHRTGTETVLGDGIVPPNNQGRVTPFYNQGNDGDRPAKEGVDDRDDLDVYTRSAIAELGEGYLSFAGQRDDGFYADIQSIFDLEFTFGRDAKSKNKTFVGRGPEGQIKPFDSQGGFNVHTIALNIPMSELGDSKMAGVHATTSRQLVTQPSSKSGEFLQVGRQGNPLFVEALIALRDKDRYNQSDAEDDNQFRVYAKDPEGDEGIEISRLLGVTPPIPGLVEGIFIPDVIKVDLTTGPARTPNDPDFHRLGFFGGDTLISKAQPGFDGNGTIPGGWPNGRRFGDDVVDVAFIAVGIEAPAPDPREQSDGPNYDRVDANDITYNDVFPYAATPLNGRNHRHH
jgi:hypothetical protein